MPAPKKKIMGRGESPVSVGARVSSGGARTSRKTVVKVKPKPNTKAEPKSNVKKRRSIVDEEVRSLRNKATSEYKKELKSGRNARDKAQEIKDMNKYGDVKKQPTKKITGK